MYKAIGEAAYNDGLFSQAAPFQAFQSSVSQFGDGGLGATSRLVASQWAPVRRSAARYVNAPRYVNARSHGAARLARDRVAGLGNAYHDGSLGSRTFLPAFSKRAMQGLGYAYNDGSLGDVIDVAACTAVGPCVNNLLAVPQPMDRALKDPFNQIVALSLVGIAAYLYTKR